MDAIDGPLDEEGQTSSASPDSPAVKVLMQAWKEVAAVAAEDARRDYAGRSARKGQQQGEQMYHI